MYEPKIIAYLCTWCSYTGADTAGIARLKSPANLRAVRVPCSGRVSPEIIMRTFDQGADGVLVLGCHIGECHYDSGNHRTAKRLAVLKTLMAYAGLDPERLHLDWVSASEGERFSRIVTEFNHRVRALGPAHYHADGWQVHDVELLSAQPLREDSACFDIQSYSIREAAIRDHAKELLADHRVDCVIGYERSPRGRVRPAFIYHPDDASRLVWNPDCTHNLTVYLSQKILDGMRPSGKKLEWQQPRIGIVVKPCDSRAIHLQLAEQRYQREQVHIIGVTCEGIREDSNINVDIGSGQARLQNRCQVCTDRTPVVFDRLVGGTISPELSDEDPYQAVDALEARTPQERMEFWLNQFDRCIRCYACRQVCPLCDCPTCLYERDDSLWVGPSVGWEGIGLNESRTFHLGRAFHLAGRCIGCDECERVCPMDIPISYLNRRLSQEVRERFGYIAGIAPVPSPIISVLSGEEGLS